MYALQQSTMIRFRQVRREEANGGQCDAASFQKLEDHGKSPRRRGAVNTSQQIAI
jgi:hypothetical protein